MLLTVNAKTKDKLLHHRAYVSLPDASVGFESHATFGLHKIEAFCYLSAGFYINGRVTNNPNQFFRLIPAFNPIRDNYPHFFYGVRYYLPEKLQLHKQFHPFLTMGKQVDGWADILIGAGFFIPFNDRLSFCLSEYIINMVFLRDNFVVNGRTKGIFMSPISTVSLGMRYYFLK